MDESNDKCPNCNEILRDSLFSSCKLVPAKETEFINKMLNKDKSGYCSKCGRELLEEAKRILSEEISRCEQILEKYIDEIPVVSLYQPYDWQYETLGIVTGQSTTGTGVVAEVFSDFSDFLGRQSKTYNRKLAEGERLCLAQLRYKTINLGGNCVIGVDIDYSELGSLKGMIMVCATGTAVKLKNIEVLKGKAKIVNLITATIEKYKKLQGEVVEKKDEPLKNLFCPSCGEEYSPEDQFCGNCSTKLKSYK